jgi:hypothetical protein
MLPGIPTASNGAWTKRDCFHFMGCDAPRLWNARQIRATFSMWAGPTAAEFVGEWLKSCEDRRCLTDDPNECRSCDLPEARHVEGVEELKSKSRRALST